jgi:hypothetical protein
MVNVCSYRTEARQGTQTVYENVPQTREVTVNVCSYQTVERTGTRTRVVCDSVQETVPVTQTYCEMVPYTYTTRVAVRVPCAPVSAPVAAGCGH